VQLHPGVALAGDVLLLGVDQALDIKERFLRAGSCGVSWPVLSKTGQGDAVTPGVLSVLQPPFLSWVLSRNRAAFCATLSHVFRSGPTVGSPAEGRLSPKQSPGSWSYFVHGSYP